MIKEYNINNLNGLKRGSLVLTLHKTCDDRRVAGAPVYFVNCFSGVARLFKHT